MAGVSVERPPAAPNPGANTERSAEIARQGQVGNRRVSTSGGGSVGPVGGAVDNTTVATPISERSVGLVPDDPANLPISWFTERLPSGTGAGSIHRESFALPFGKETLADDMKNVVHFAQEIDKDIVRASELLEKLEQKPLNEKEQREVKTLLGAGKYNLEQVKRWASVAKGEFEGRPAGLEFMTKLEERLTDRHMDLTDLMCLYDIDQAPPEQAVSRADRIDHNLVAADAALKVARGLTAVSGLSEEAQQQLVTVLEDHRAGLDKAKDIVIDSNSDSAQVLSKDVWDIVLTKGKKAGGSMAALHQQWDAKAAGATGDWLPLVHPKLTQEQMLQGFVSHQLKRAGVTKKNRPDLKFQFKEATNQVRNERPWEPIEKQLHYTVMGGTPRTVHSKITPARVMAGAEHFTEDLPANGICCGDRMQYKHVPNLARTELTDASGKTLFSALRHGVLDAYDISTATLRKLSDQALFTTVKDLLIPQWLRESATGEHNVAARVNDIVDEIHTNKGKASKYASAMRTAASAKMAEELAVTALVSDPDKLQAALRGEEVDLTLNSISLLTPDRFRSTPMTKAQSNEREMLGRQTEALKKLNGNTNLEVYDDASGGLRTVQVNCKVRTFNFGVNAGAVGKAKHIPSHLRGWDKLMGWGYSMERNTPELRNLLGNPRDEALGGEVQEKLTEHDHRIENISRSLNNARAGSQFDVEVPRFGRELKAAVYKRATLANAATEAKKIWREGSYNKGGQDPYKMVSRLGMVINEMGETLAFNCKSGKDRTGQLDAELKYLTAISAEGMIPAPGARVTSQLRQIRSDFTLNSGNLEMQRINTGLPGFKLDIKEVPGLANFIDPAMESRYRGGSNYINS